MKRLIGFVLFVCLVSVTAACGAGAAGGDSKETIKIGATAGPYSDQLKEGIAPILEEQGYKLEVVEFNDYIQPNNALDEGSIDANLYQNIIYLEQFNIDHGIDLVGDYAVPSAPIALYSNKFDSLDDIEEGAKITLPNDPTNLARSLHMLVDAGLIEIDETVKQTIASEKDITENKLNLEILPIEAAQTVRSLDDADFAFVNGNFAISAGLDFLEAVDIEQTPEEYLIYIAFRSGDEDGEIAQVLKDAFHSDEFYEYTQENLQGFVLPPYQLERE
ncbi:MAG TPA: MetQ/NlpA family ABC transporter substrate-binding protein [Pseudogracilibacillus sp.]|nr:MetQ/NlpA family ABC transporter substrate-binding protein [Pseudogracilibacillus sp.]